MKEIEEYINSIKQVDTGRDAEVQEHLDFLTKPPGSLGRLEEIAKEFIRASSAYPPEIKKKTIFVMAGDHGVAEEGVSAFPQEVTAQMVGNFINGGAAINVLSRHIGCETKVVDMGVKGELGNPPGLIDKKVGHGTKNFAKEAAMTEEELVKALKAGIGLAEEAAREGTSLIGTGDMGIANTTPSTALYCALLGFEPEEITGKGTGIDGKTVEHKAMVIKKAVEKHAPYKSPLDALMKIGGYEIAGLTGLIFGAAKNDIPIVIDGFISTAAAVVAMESAPFVRRRLFFSHLSQEKGHRLVCEKLDVRPILDIDMRLGEGTGAALAIGIIEASIKLYNEMATFKSANVSNKE